MEFASNNSYPASIGMAPYEALYGRKCRTPVCWCHAPDPGPTRLADPNRFPGRETQDWDSLPDFFFFF